MTDKSLTDKPLTGKPVAAVRPASTVLLLRDVPAGMEVFMVVRHHQIDFASGALVFPGGSVDPGDRDPRVRLGCAGAEGLEDEALAFRVAAIREAFEECGVLLARPRGAEALVGADRLARLEERYRRALERDEIRIADMLEAEDLELACDWLVPYARWITPEIMPKRFDTWFFLATAPADQIAVHDGTESVDSVWIRPQDACAEADAGRRTVIFPTRMNLEKLARSRSVAEAFAAARAEPVVTVLPRVEKAPGGRIMRIPIEAGYGISEVHLEGAPGAGGTARRVQLAQEVKL